jgi:hypothetical protein
LTDSTKFLIHNVEEAEWVVQARLVRVEGRVIFEFNGFVDVAKIGATTTRRPEAEEPKYC